MTVVIEHRGPAGGTIRPAGRSPFGARTRLASPRRCGAPSNRHPSPRDNPRLRGGASPIRMRGKVNPSSQGASVMATETGTTPLSDVAILSRLIRADDDPLSADAAEALLR